MSRVVCETETSRLLVLSSSAFTNDVFPAPLGAETTYSWPVVLFWLFKILHLLAHLLYQYFELYCRFGSHQ